MKALSVIELAKLYGMNRQSIYKRINKGDLSKNSDGKIDLSEAIRVFGEPGQRSSANVAQVQSTTLQKSTEVDILSKQVDMLQKQLENAQEREQFQREQLKAKDEQIYTLQLLLGAPKKSEQERVTDDRPPVENVPEATSVSTMGKVRGTESVQINQPKRRSFLGKLLSSIIE